MASYHINPDTGKASKCFAKKKCPFGSVDDTHYESFEQARAVYERLQGNAFSGITAAPDEANHYVGLPYGADIKDFEITAIQESAYHYGNYNNADAKAMPMLAAMAQTFSSPARLALMVSYAGQHLSPREIAKNDVVLRACLTNPATGSDVKEKLAVSIIDVYNALTVEDVEARRPIAELLSRDLSVSSKARRRLKKTFAV